VTLLVRPSRYLHYNAGAFVSGGEACLVDPGLLSEEIEALLADVGDRSVRYVVLTHADWDHVLGPEHLPEATVVAHAAYVDELDPGGIRAILRRLEERAGVVRARPFEPPEPALTFEKALQLAVGDLELHLEHAPGHTASMLTIYEPADACLWAADVLSDVELPMIAYDLESYARTLARIAELEVRTLVPGHGTPTSEASEIRRRLDEDRLYLDRLRRAVADAVEAGNSLEATVDACASIALSRSDEDVVTHRLNVEKVYADLGGDADPAEVGFARAWKETTGA
jgi:glyoxylase-like metal-dependent hydrolase (beta-lactamase superfamily II)